MHGGIIGLLQSINSKIKECYNGINGNINGKYWCVAGIAGGSHGGIENVYNLGNMEGKAFVGGICGSQWQDTNQIYESSYIRNTYNTGSIFGKSYSGGIAGGIYSSYCNNIINVGVVDKSSNGVAINDAIGEWYTDVVWENGTWLESSTTSQATMKEWTDADIKSYLGNNFAKDTKGINNGLPILSWQAE